MCADGPGGARPRFLALGPVQYNISRFPSAVKEGDLDCLSQQFRNYQVLDEFDLPPPVDSTGNARRLDDVWHDISLLLDPAMQRRRFGVLCKFAAFLLLIPHSNAFCEGLFTIVRKVCTDSHCHHILHS